MGSKEPKPWSPRWVTLEESFTESFRMEEGGGRRSQRCLARERERETTSIGKNIMIGRRKGSWQSKRYSKKSVKLVGVLL
jgi:hypothetical protein